MVCINVNFIGSGGASQRFVNSGIINLNETRSRVLKVTEHILSTLLNEGISISLLQ